MQQELTKQKREIISIFLKNGILVSSDLLKEIDDYEHVSRIFGLLNSKDTADLAVIGSDISKIIKDTKTIETHQPQEKRDSSQVKIVQSYTDNPK